MQKEKVFLKKLSFFLLMIILSSSMGLLAQSSKKVRVRGYISDINREPLIGVSVQEKGTSNGVITDVNGVFSMEVNQNATLVASYVGCATQEIPVRKQADFNIVLQEDAQFLNEVVVVGYGTQKKGNLTGAIASIKSDEILKTTHSSLAQSLQGKVSGLQIRQNNGEPGNFDNMINIRGFGTPLFVIDGIPRDGANEFQRLNPNDIESISVLKDASAAIYGLNAANGVILVTTKKGKQGKPTFSYSGVVGFQKPTDVVKMMNAVQFLEIQNDANINMGQAPLTPKDELDKWRQGGPGYQSTDWFGEAFKKSSLQHQHNLSVTGGGDNVNFYFSLGYVSDDGIVKNNGYNYEKYTFRSNVTANLSKYLKADIEVSGRYDTKAAPNYGFLDIFKGTRTSWPTQTPYANNNPEYPSKVGPTNNNPAAASNTDLTGTNEDKWKSLQTSLALTWDVPFVKGLQLKGRAAYDSNSKLSKNLHKAYNVYTYLPESETYQSETIGGKSNISNSNEDHNKLLLQAQISYNRLFNERHNVGATLVYEQSKYTYRTSWLQREYDFFTNDQIDQASPNNQQTSGHEDEQASMSYVGRFNYDFMSKYLVEFAFRYDGSYRYAPGSRWGFFPVVSAGYRISEESFIKDNVSFIDNLKIRASYGQVGENAGEPFQYIQGFTTSGGGGYEFINGEYTVGAASPLIVNPNLTWFKSNVLDVGIDIALFKGLFNMEFDLYQRDRKGLLARRNLSLPNTFGGSLPEENLNSDRVQGFDLSISHNNRIRDFRYGVRLNLNYARTMQRYVERGPFRSSWERWKGGTSNRWNDIVWGYEVAGQFQNMNDIVNAPLQNGNQGNKKELPGDFMYQDVNGDGVISDADMRPNMWGGQPKLHYGISLEASWKGFDFNALFQGSGKYSVRYKENQIDMLSFGGNSPEFFTDRWHKADQFDPNSEWVSGRWPAARRTEDRGAYFNESNVWRRDASYLRLKSLELGYTFPNQWLRKSGVSDLRLYVNAFNVFTWTDDILKGFDPEKTEGDWNVGYTYPVMRSFNVGVNISF
ncbi:TonB-dependent receptor [Bacteroides fragilis]|nr:TonB-dependent receptor [Bacteroides fragilis]